MEWCLPSLQISITPIFSSLPERRSGKPVTILVQHKHRRRQAPGFLLFTCPVHGALRFSLNALPPSRIAIHGQAENSQS